MYRFYAQALSLANTATIYFSQVIVPVVQQQTMLDVKL